ncbi:MAG: nickel pincer cofactor biosynthesis protein LarC [Chloroflexi bacterium]|nr:nickel pincer cofactor biosynthesis protein LarC [Chloroflexota bacterium]
MRIAYFDTVGGAAGDMIIGSLLDAGLSFQELESELLKLKLSGYRLSRERVVKRHIAATQFRVHLDREHDDHEHHHHGHHRAHGRALADIEGLIRTSDLGSGPKETALKIFRRLGEAEAKVHGVPIESVHFHEVGAVDSIVDIVGSAVALDILGLDEVFSSPLPAGSGTVMTQHGEYPIPAPATLELAAMSNAPVNASTLRFEQVTPTGAAVLTTVATFRQPDMRVSGIGYGAGEANLEVPNVLRVWLGESEQNYATQALSVLSTNIDDMSPELCPAILEGGLAAGALDAWITPVVMKKGRPAVTVSLLCEPQVEPRLVEFLLRHTSTLGVRVASVARYAAEREMRTVDTRFGPLPVKVKRLQGAVVGASPEFEECAKVAAAFRVPAIDVYVAGVAAGVQLVENAE